ncbi:hypothetical protein LS41612_15145 [Lysinibacillus sphaericus]|uniref:Transposase n=1 Tax=Lysinibacillus sphaericus TaxID=1421 RepID=A0A2S0K2B0_LYSSH|nr:hypothetical protein LS41612_15145 [Lysinibacillus sphaericus]
MHMLVSILPKLRVSSFVGYLKEKNRSTPYHQTIKIHVKWTFWNRCRNVKM